MLVAWLNDGGRTGFHYLISVHSCTGDLLNIDEMLIVFGFFLMVLIGLELLETIKSYPEHDRVHAEIVFLVAIVAVSRKVVILNYKEITPDILYGMAAIIMALSVGYFLVRRALDGGKLKTKPLVKE